MSGPIKPSEVAAARAASLPEEVFQVFNAMIVEEWNGHEARVMQGAAAKRVAEVLHISAAKVFDRGLLDVESAYRAAGWKVTYDKPGFNEAYEAFFVFERKRR